MKQYCVINKMAYSEEEIKKYTNILRNFEDGLDVYTPVLDKHIPLKIPENVSCENCGNTPFLKDHGFHYCNKCNIHVYQDYYPKKKTQYFHKIDNDI